MKLYGPEFAVVPLSPYPSAALAFSSLREACEAYREFAQDCERWGQTPAVACLYVGQPDGDEERLGYPDYPDYMIDRGPRGGIRRIYP